MIDSLDESCKAWGACTRWMRLDKSGFPTRDTIARAADGLLSAKASGAQRQHFAEVRVGEALAVARAIARRPVMPEELVAIVWAQYATEATTKQRIAALEKYLSREIPPSEYWRILDRAHHFLLGRVERP